MPEENNSQRGIKINDFLCHSLAFTTVKLNFSSDDDVAKRCLLCCYDPVMGFTAKSFTIITEAFKWLFSYSY